MTDETTDGDRATPAYRRRLTANEIDRRTILRSGAALLGTAGLAGCLTDDGDGGDGGDGNGDGGDGTAGDGTGTGDGTSTGDGGSGGTTNIAIVSSPAGFGDRAFNDLALEGLQNAAEEYDIELQQVEETDQSQYGTVQSRLAESQNPDYDLIVLVSYNHTQALQTNAEEYPDQRWMLINAHVEQPNVAGYTWANHEMSFQAGVLAGTMTTRELSHEGNTLNPDNATIGFVGGVDGALINAFERSYVAGAEWVNEDVDVRVGYIGNYTDTQTANNIASSQYDAGADIVYHAAAAAGQGVFQAAQDAQRFAVGVDADQSVTLPDYQDVIMGSAVKYINRGTAEVAQAVVEDNWESVQGPNVLGLEEDAVEVVLGQAVGPKLPDVVTQNLEESKQAIVGGDITVPCTAGGCQD
ncbi:BMP family ABC transporter substrate-binding protein [Halomicroarcula limicola]|uniref:BMP family ABC transporter substrate-binding protein n=1 Tax=Haloarcula limicola TaxID=1429915 RepID=A0A8J8C4L3_9EURY|nr:BMP family ABC transporter substrate-binding protein [Halomicroarcula limicola]MBV0925392.1 BMP family ABC transporter substrate-binding protein [Halomicroarcula limicola]